MTAAGTLDIVVLQPCVQSGNVTARTSVITVTSFKVGGFATCLATMLQPVRGPVNHLLNTVFGPAKHGVRLCGIVQPGGWLFHTFERHITLKSFGKSVGKIADTHRFRACHVQNKRWIFGVFEGTNRVSNGLALPDHIGITGFDTHRNSTVNLLRDIDQDAIPQIDTVVEPDQ